MKHFLVSGGMLATDVFVHINDFVSRPEVRECHFGLLALGMMGLLLSAIHFGRATTAALTEYGETFTI